MYYSCSSLCSLTVLDLNTFGKLKFLSVQVEPPNSSSFRRDSRTAIVLLKQFGRIGT